MKLYRFFLIVLSFSTLFANDRTECIAAPKPNILKTTQKAHSIPLRVNGLVEVTASITKRDLTETIRGYPNPDAAISEVKACFYLTHDEAFSIFSGRQEQCDLFDGNGNAQVKWILEAKRPGSHKISVSLSWINLKNLQEQPISLSQSEGIEEIVVQRSLSWVLDSILDSWDKIIMMLLALASFIASVCALNKSKNWLWVIPMLLVLFLVGLVIYWALRH